MFLRAAPLNWLQCDQPRLLQHALDDYATFKCINFIREVVASNGNPISQLQQGPQVFSNDRLLKPVLQDDALLFHDFAAVADQGCVVVLLNQPSLVWTQAITAVIVTIMALPPSHAIHGAGRRGWLHAGKRARVMLRASNNGLSILKLTTRRF